MARDKKDVPVKVAKTKPPRVRYKNYWVELRDIDFEVIDTLVLPPDAPVRNTGSQPPTLTTISECETWEDLEFFYESRWHTARLLEPPKKYMIRVERTISETTSDPWPTVLEKYRQSYGNSSVITLVETKELAELADAD